MSRRYAIRDEITRLDPERDCQRIVFLSTCYDFPFDTTRSLEFALFRTFAAPRISALLDKTGEFGSRAQKRYDDTDIIVSELLEHGYASERGEAALRRMNQIHGRFAIANEDFLYVLSTFIFEPIRWNERFGWRPLCEQERLAYFNFWRAVGERMRIRDIPAEYEDFERYNRQYEAEQFRFCQSNQSVAAATRELIVGWAPRSLAPLVRRAIYALLDDRLIEAFGFPHASPVLRWLVPAALRLRAGMLKWLPPRRTPRLRTEMKRPSYPGGYELGKVGPIQAKE